MSSKCRATLLYSSSRGVEYCLPQPHLLNGEMSMPAASNSAAKPGVVYLACSSALLESGMTQSSVVAPLQHGQMTLAVFIPAA